MRRRLRDSIRTASAALAGTLACSPPCNAAQPLAAAPAVHGPEIMLYFSQPIGPSTSTRSFGLRIDQHSLPALLPAPTTNPSDLSGRRELLNLRMAAHQGIRLDFGRRLSWDFAAHRLGTPSEAAAVRIRTASQLTARSPAMLP